MSNHPKPLYQRPKRFKTSEMPVGSLVTLSYGPRPQDNQPDQYEITEIVHASKKGRSGYISIRKPENASWSRGVGCSSYRVGSIVRKGPAPEISPCPKILLDSRPSPVR